ncbi:OB-fold nucleic acid binding domain-containing protein [Mycobacterium sp. D16R24]|uniref:Zn-ribbon domain-containing OB-fold protein n=1 Tax=Mycobacterium sp. D16R24 TaxID=1855656 RepID=UPI0011163022|nr:OB-fold nucleic acid binding domain-containing protein [Mycobacterium sp. D16R24]
MTVSQSSTTGLTSPLPLLSAPLELSFDYTRSVGPTLSKFFTALRDRQIVGTRGSDGRVYVPAAEYDPVTYAPLTEMVPVSSVGTVQSWSWQPEPLEGQPLAKPFAWALITLDGADTALLHAVDTGAAGSAGIETGARVHAVWADETVGAITDIAYFALGDRPVDVPAPASDQEPVTMQVTPIRLEVQHITSPEESAYLRALAEGKLLGGRTGAGGRVYFPARGADPLTGEPTSDLVQVADKGVVTTFAIINIPFPGQRIKPPYVAAYVLLDGADIPFLHLVYDIDPADVRMGMRVEAVWKPKEEWGYGIDNIQYFRPTGEPDADYETYKDRI